MDPTTDPAVGPVVRRPRAGAGIATHVRVNDPAQLVGWGASAILFATILQQIWKQWHARDTKGVSTWLFVGQFAASTGFLVYSVLVGDPVFIVTNAALAAAAVLGFVLLLVHRRAEPGAD
jgi:MtN3 and saliva related transmembrane protein